ncbi:hypothetical protein [Haloarchaeobius sp. DT45]|uniref:hypothetical protein n=1 Tax=Haloarchaeobius sp. DT45 TaxID=3446116 RepID=UPI003F6A897E
MNRRAVLAQVSALFLSGCAGWAGRGDTSSSTPSTQTRPATTSATEPATETETTTKTETGSRTRTTVATPATAELETATEPVRTATAETPAVVELSLRNAGPDPVEVLFGATPPLTNYGGVRVDGAGHLKLFPLDSAGLVGIENSNGDDEISAKAYDGDCWLVADTVSPVALLKRRRLEPGAAIARQYEVLSAGSGCGPDGDYLFTESVRFPNSDERVDLAFRIDVPVS